MGFKIASSGDCQNLQFWCTSQFGARLGGSLAPTSVSKPIVFKMASFGDFQNSQFWCTSDFCTRLGVSENHNFYSVFSVWAWPQIRNGPDTTSYSGVWRRGEIGKGWDCNAWLRWPHLKHVWNIPSHTLLQTNYCTRNSRKNQQLFDHCELLRRMNYCTNYCDTKQLLQRHPLRNPPLLQTPKLPKPAFFTSCVFSRVGRRLPLVTTLLHTVILFWGIFSVIITGNFTAM